MIKLGLWGARGDRRGLHIQGAEFCRHLNPCRVMGFDVKSRHNQPAPDWSDYRDSNLTVMRYPKVTKHLAQQWMEGLDVVWGVETFYQDDFPAWANEMGVATIQHVNPEFYRFDNEPQLPRPTLELAPSPWRLDKMSGVSRWLATPVALDRLKYTPRPINGDLVTFLHVVGTKAEHDRNGTEVVLEAIRMVHHPCRLLVLSQSEPTFSSGQIGWVTVETRHLDLPNYWDLYAEGDVLLMPRRYGGQCLPMHEAMACGLPVVMPAIDPNTDPTYADLGPAHTVLVPVTGRTDTFHTQAGPVTVHHPNPHALADRMETLARSPALVCALSRHARDWAETRSWAVLEHRYRSLIANVVDAYRTQGNRATLNR